MTRNRVLPPEIATCFPNLTEENHKVTSDEDLYNCLAYAAGRNDVYWWPDIADGVTWPEGVPFEVNIDAFEKIYTDLGFERCEDYGFDSDYEKIVIYAYESGEPSHAARQLDNGVWVSKLGPCQDIEHDSPDVLAGDDPAYGNVVRVLRRPWTT